MTATPPVHTEKTAVEKALEAAINAESGTCAFNLKLYKEAIEILKTSDSENFFMKFPPLLTPAIEATLQVAYPIYQRHFGDTANMIMAGILKLNRKLSLYAQKASWTEEMHIAAIFSQCRLKSFFTERFLRSRLKRMRFHKSSIQAISRIVFEAPDFSRLHFEKGDDVAVWKDNVFNLLVDLRSRSAPTVLIFCGIELDQIYFLKKELKKKNHKVWEESDVSQKDQLWYYGKIVQIIKPSVADENVQQMMLEYEDVLLKIYKMFEPSSDAVLS